MKPMTPLTIAALAASLGILAHGCGGSAQAPASRPAADGKVATVGDRTITGAELGEHVRSKLIEIETQRYDALREGLDEMIAEELVKQEASARGTTPADLEKQEVAGKLGDPSDADIQKVYDDNKAQLGSQM